MHTAINALQVGDPLQLETDGDCYRLLDASGHNVGRTARAFRLPFEPRQCRVAAILTRFAEDGEPEYHHHVKCNRWQFVMPLLVG